MGLRKKSLRLPEPAPGSTTFTNPDIQLNLPCTSDFLRDMFLYGAYLATV